MLVGIPPFYHDNMKVLYENIQKGKLKLPKYLSNDSKNCVKKMLQKDPKNRPTITQLMSDPFFSDIDWNALEKKQLDPPQVLIRENSTPDDDKLMQKMKNSRNEDEEILFVDENENEERGRSKNVLDDEDYTTKNKNF